MRAWAYSSSESSISVEVLCVELAMDRLLLHAKREEDLEMFSHSSITSIIHCR